MGSFLSVFKKWVAPETPKLYEIPLLVIIRKGMMVEE
jgi:hypothetical protein